MGATYDHIASDYDQSFLALPVRKYLEAFSVLKFAGEAQGKTVLDVGCGTGIYARTLRRAGAASVVGVDLSEEMLRVARVAEGEAPLGIEYRIGDASQLDAIGSFDLALGVYLLHYAPSREALVAMCRGLAKNLAPGGRFASFALNPSVSTQAGAYARYGLCLRFDDPDADGSRVHFSIKTPAYSSPEIAIFRWSRSTLEEALREAGFCEIAWHQPEVAPEGLAQHGPSIWQEYLDTPYCVVLTAIKA